MLSLGLLNVEPGFAAGKQCSLATLKGQFMVTATGTLFPPAFGVTAPSVSTVAGYSIYNGDGTGTDYVTFAVDGEGLTAIATDSGFAVSESDSRVKSSH
jgi:hypothetical protein